MTTTPDNSYRFTWPYILEYQKKDKGLYIGENAQGYRPYLNEVFDTSYFLNHQDPRIVSSDDVPDDLDLVIVDNPTTLDDTTIADLVANLAEEGRVALKVDSVGRSSYFSKAFGFDQGQQHTSIRNVIQLLRNSLNQCRITSKYCLISSYRRETTLMIDLDSESGRKWLVSQGEQPGANPLIKTSMRIARSLSKTQLFKYLFPAYVFTISKGRDGASPYEVQKSTINKSTLLNFNQNDVEEVVKIPVKGREDALNREISVMKEIRSQLSGEFAETVPFTETEERNRRYLVRESPVYGDPISKYYIRETDALSKSVRLPFEWTAEIVSTTAKGKETVTTEDLKSLLSFNGNGFYPDTQLPLQMEYATVPCHGDFFGSNILVNDRRVTGVIDWEWGTRDGNPVLDPGFYLLQLAETLFSSFEEGLRKLFLYRTTFSEIVWQHLREYCATIGFSLREFVLLLPYPYIRRAEMQRNLYSEYDESWVEKARTVLRMNESLLADSALNQTL